MKWITDATDAAGNELGGEAKQNVTTCNCCGRDGKIILPKYNTKLRLCDICLETEVK